MDISWEMLTKDVRGRKSCDVATPQITVCTTSMTFNKSFGEQFSLKSGDLINIFVSPEGYLGVQKCQDDEERKNGYKLYLPKNGLSLKIQLGKGALQQKLASYVGQSQPAQQMENSRIIAAKFKKDTNEVLETRESILDEAFADS
jgi:hypothetical protein